MGVVYTQKVQEKFKKCYCLNTIWGPLHMINPVNRNEKPLNRTLTGWKGIHQGIGPIQADLVKNFKQNIFWTSDAYSLTLQRSHWNFIQLFNVHSAHCDPSETSFRAFFLNEIFWEIWQRFHFTVFCMLGTCLVYRSYWSFVLHSYLNLGTSNTR